MLEARYRDQVYKNAFSGRKNEVSIQDLKAFIAVSLQYLEHSIDANKRDR